MISKLAVRQLYESLGPKAFALKWRELLGLTEERSTGRTVVKNAQLTPNQVSLKALTEGILGESWVESLGRRSAQGQIRELFESNPAISPSNFANTSAWGLALAGTLEAAILEGFSLPTMISDELLTTKPTNLRINRTFGVGRLGNLFEEIAPGEPHPALTLSEEYVEAPPTKKIGGKVLVTREAVFFDLTGQVLDHAREIGERLRLNHEIRALRTVVGLDNSYRYNDQAFNTYYDAGDNGPWINEIDIPLTNWLSINQARMALSKVVDPSTGLPAGADAYADTLLVPPALEFSARALVGATSVRATSDGIATATEFPNPLAGTNTRVFSSALLYSLLTAPAPQGLGLSPTVANNVWFYGAPRRAFTWFENWSIVTRTAAEDSAFMQDRDLVLQMTTNEMGTAAIQRPQYFLRSIPQAGYLVPGGAPVLVPSAPIPTIDLTPETP